MSGGHFDYDQYRIDDIAESIKELIKDNEKDDGYGARNYKKPTIDMFKMGIRALRTASVFAQRIDWLVCGDDSEETFHVRLNNDLEALNDEHI